MDTADLPGGNPRRRATNRLGNSGAGVPREKATERGLKRRGGVRKKAEGAVCLFGMKSLPTKTHPPGSWRKDIVPVRMRHPAANLAVDWGRDGHSERTGGIISEEKRGSPYLISAQRSVVKIMWRRRHCFFELLKKAKSVQAEALKGTRSKKGTAGKVKTKFRTTGDGEVKSHTKFCSVKGRKGSQANAP